MVVVVPLIEPVTPGVPNEPLASLPGVVVVVLVPGPPMEVVLPGVVPLVDESVLVVPVVDPLMPVEAVPEVLELPVEPVELVDVAGTVSVVVDDVEGVGGSARLLQAPRDSAAVTARMAVAYLVVDFMGNTPVWGWC